jgi:glyoxylase-like metal-dependent hydrolase (beta-lactamase superfamily II)
MRVAPRTHLVASGGIVGFELTDFFDCSVWLVDTGDGYALFDSGSGRDLDGLLRVLADDGLDASAVRHLFLTHAHADHSGGASHIHERLRPRIHAGRGTADILAQNDDRLISLDKARKGGFYPADYVWQAAPVDRVLADLESVTIGDCTITTYETPGHSDDHVSFIVECEGRRSLITGDALFAGPRITLQDVPDSNVSKSLETIRRLGTLEFDAFLPGHGLFTVRNGRKHVDQAMAYANRLVPPPNLL